MATQETFLLNKCGQPCGLRGPVHYRQLPELLQSHGGAWTSVSGQLPKEFPSPGSWDGRKRPTWICPEPDTTHWWHPAAFGKVTVSSRLWGPGRLGNPSGAGEGSNAEPVLGEPLGRGRSEVPARKSWGVMEGTNYRHQEDPKCG